MVGNTISLMNNFTTPFFTDTLAVGSLNRTSTVAVVYTPKSIPTPWPIELAGVIMTFASAIWTIIRVKKAAQKWWIAFAFTALNFIRAFSSFISVLKAFTHRDDPDGPGRWLAVSMVGSFTLATIPFSLKTPHPFKPFGVLTTCMSLTTFVLMLIVQWSKDVPGRLPYGGVEIIGGNCPVFIGSCNDTTIPWAKQIGCGWNMTTAPSFSPKTPVSIVEQYASMVMLWPIILLFGPLVWLSPLVLLLLWGMIDGMVQWVRKPTYDAEEEALKVGKKWLIALAVLQILFILSVGLISVTGNLITVAPNKVGQQVQVYGIVDSFGPPRNLTTEVAGNSWSDCFPIPLPTSNLGFITEWWDKQKRRPETWLGFT
jgi:hypothetical protein